jgi:hypothetical protein
MAGALGRIASATRIDAAIAAAVVFRARRAGAGMNDDAQQTQRVGPIQFIVLTRPLNCSRRPARSSARLMRYYGV